MAPLLKHVAGGRPALAAAIALALLLSPATLRAQAAAALPDPTRPPNSKLASLKGDVTAALRNKKFEPVSIEQFDEYFNDYLLLQFAEPSSSPNKIRADLRSKYFMQGRSGAPYARLNTLVFNMMKSIIITKFPPEPKYYAVKYNAMLVIGELNEQESDAVAKAPAKPLPEALEYMLKMVRNPKVPDYLRVPALTGIESHAKSNSDVALAPEARANLIKTMLDLLNQQTPPANRTADAQVELRRKAAMILGELGEAGTGGNTEIVDALAATLRNIKNPPSLRCGAAEAIGGLRLPGGGRVDTGTLIHDLVDLATTVCRAEVKFSEANEIPPNRRRLASTLYSVKRGTFGLDGNHGVAAAASEEQRDLITQVRISLMALIKKVSESKDLTATELAKLAPLQNLEKAVKGLGKSAVTAGPGPAPVDARRRPGSRTDMVAREPGADTSRDKPPAVTE